MYFNIFYVTISNTTIYLITTQIITFYLYNINICYKFKV